MTLVTWLKCGRISASGNTALQSLGLGTQPHHFEAKLLVSNKEQLILHLY